MDFEFIFQKKIVMPKNGFQIYFREMTMPKNGLFKFIF